MLLVANRPGNGPMLIPLSYRDQFVAEGWTLDDAPPGVEVSEPTPLEQAMPAPSSTRATEGTPATTVKRSSPASPDRSDGVVPRIVAGLSTPIVCDAVAARWEEDSRLPKRQRARVVFREGE